MSYARFLTEQEAQTYADAVQAELSKNPAYIASKWSDVITGSDGAYYVSAHQSVSYAEGVDSVPSLLDEITDGY
jgi:hypothetical protein